MQEILNGKHKYSYEGPISVYDRVTARNWKGETYAISPKQALNNLKYQYQVSCLKSCYNKVTLDEKCLKEER